MPPRNWMIRNTGRKPSKLLTLPHTFSFRNHALYDFEPVLDWFDWGASDQKINLDLRQCNNANYQALALLVLYTWYLKANGSSIDIDYDIFSDRSASRMWSLMGARGWSQVLYQEGQNFNGHPFKPLLAIRNESDFRTALTRSEEYTRGFNVEYEKTLHYVVSELLYNTLEHGRARFSSKGRVLRCPSVIQFTWYRNRDDLSFIIADLGVGIKRHLENAYPPFEDDVAAIRHAIKPQVSGTFTKSQAYGAKNNAGVGLYLSTNIVQRLHAEMFIVSGSGLLHISPRDITGKGLSSRWPGTFVLVTIKLRRQPMDLSLQGMLAEFRESARREISTSEVQEFVSSFPVSVYNYFGRYAENKEEAIRFRDQYLVPEIRRGKSVLLDFSNVVSSPHSFLSALLATPVRILGMQAYKLIKITNAPSEIRETIDYILDENTVEGTSPEL